MSTTQLEMGVGGPRPADPPGSAAGAGFHHAGDNMPTQSHHDDEVLTEAKVQSYWRENVKLLLGLLTVWFAVSFGAGILFVDQLNHIQIGGYPLGFWFAQQGSIFAFVGLIFIYTVRMHALDRRFGVDDDA